MRNFKTKIHIELRILKNYNVSKNLLLTSLKKEKVKNLSQLFSSKLFIPGAECSSLDILKNLFTDCFSIECLYHFKLY